MSNNNKTNNRCPYCGLGKPGFDIDKCGMPYCSEEFRRKERWYNTAILMAGPFYVGIVMLYTHPDRLFEIGGISLLAMVTMFIIGRFLK